MEARIKRAGVIALAALGMTLAAGAAMASDNHIVVVPGGPHPYFAPWEQAARGGRRFGELRDRIPVLSTIASEQGVERIDDLGDVIPLLFQHSVYKSYPVSLLVKNKFTAMTRALHDALAQTDGPALGAKASAFALAQREFRESVPAEALRYE